MTELQKCLVACIFFETLVGGILWLHYFSPWAWERLP
jgi:hypothetical protein